MTTKALFLIAIGAGASLGAGIWTTFHQSTLSLSVLLLLTAAILTFALHLLTRTHSLATPADLA